MKKTGKRKRPYGRSTQYSIFLHQAQTGAQCLDEITKRMSCHSFSQKMFFAKSCSYKKNMPQYSKQGLTGKAAQCRKCSFPSCARESKKNIHILRRTRSGFYGKRQERRSSARIGGFFFLLLFYVASGGVTSPDFFHSIDWENADTGHTAKNIRTLRIPLSAVVGNAIYVPESKGRIPAVPRLFLTETHLFLHWSTQGIANT